MTHAIHKGSKAKQLKQRKSKDATLKKEYQTNNYTNVKSLEADQDETPLEPPHRLLHREAEQDELSPEPRYRKFFTRCSLIFMTCSLLYYTSKQGDKVFVKQGDQVARRTQIVPCSVKYKAEIESFTKCIPLHCGRMVSDNLITDDEANTILDIGKRGFNLGGSDGGASILDLHSGALSSGKVFVNIYKLDEGRRLFTPKDFLTYKIVRSKIQSAIAKHFGLAHNAIYLTHPTFFSRLTAKPPATPHDEYWHAHVDKETYQSFHYTSLLYLNDYGRDYYGGRFAFIEKNNKTMFVEPRKGRVSMFTSGWENVHFVERVSSGTRYAMTVSFTCDPKYSIPDPSWNIQPA